MRFPQVALYILIGISLCFSTAAVVRSALKIDLRFIKTALANVDISRLPRILADAMNESLRRWTEGEQHILDMVQRQDEREQQ